MNGFIALTTLVVGSADLSSLPFLHESHAVDALREAANLGASLASRADNPGTVDPTAAELVLAGDLYPEVPLLLSLVLGAGVSLEALRADLLDVRDGAEVLMALDPQHAPMALPAWEAATQALLAADTLLPPTTYAPVSVWRGAEPRVALDNSPATNAAAAATARARHRSQPLFDPATPQDRLATIGADTVAWYEHAATLDSTHRYAILVEGVGAATLTADRLAGGWARDPAHAVDAVRWANAVSLEVVFAARAWNAGNSEDAAAEPLRVAWAEALLDAMDSEATLASVAPSAPRPALAALHASLLQVAAPLTDGPALPAELQYAVDDSAFLAGTRLGLLDGRAIDQGLADLLKHPIRESARRPGCVAVATLAVRLDVRQERVQSLDALLRCREL